MMRYYTRCEQVSEMVSKKETNSHLKKLNRWESVIFSLLLKDNTNYKL